MIPVRDRPGITEDFTITTICLHGTPSFAGTPQVQVPKSDPLKATFGGVTKNSLALIVGCILATNFQNSVQFLMSLFPNKIPNATLDMLAYL